jgi:hypothetical protein
MPARVRSGGRMKSSELEIVRASFKHYATRGSFRSFSEQQGSGGHVEFDFLWFRDVKFRVVYDPARRRLTFVKLLPAVPARSSMDRLFRAFVASRCETSLPAHRGVDLGKVGLTVVNRNGAVSLVFTLKPKHIEYGVKKAVHLVHEVLMDFLNDSLYVDYNIDHFNLDPELA